MQAKNPGERRSPSGNETKHLLKKVDNLWFCFFEIIFHKIYFTAFEFHVLLLWLLIIKAEMWNFGACGFLQICKHLKLLRENNCLLLVKKLNGINFGLVLLFFSYMNFSFIFYLFFLFYRIYIEQKKIQERNG